MASAIHLFRTFIIKCHSNMCLYQTNTEAKTKTKTMTINVNVWHWLPNVCVPPNQLRGAYVWLCEHKSNFERRDLPNVILIIIARGKKDVWWLNTINPFRNEMKREQCTGPRVGPADFAYCYWPGHWAIHHAYANVNDASFTPSPFLFACAQIWFHWI